MELHTTAIFGTTHILRKLPMSKYKIFNTENKILRAMNCKYRRAEICVPSYMVCVRNMTELQFRSDPARKLSANLYDIYPCCVYSEKTPDDGQRNCPKQVEFYSKNQFEKLVHLVGFIIRIYHDARSPERQYPA